MIQWLCSHRQHALFGTSTGLSGVTLAEFLRRVDWISFIGFAGSAIAAVANWWLNKRAEIARQRIELEREKRQADRDEAQAQRDEELKVLLHSFRKHELEAGHDPREVLGLPVPREVLGLPAPPISPAT